MKKWIALIALITLLACALIPHAAFTEDRDTVLLARAIYALARGESYDAKLAIGCRYDAESLRAAHAVLSGRRNLAPSAVYYQSDAATEPRTDKPVSTVGSFSFYASEVVL